MRGNDRSPREDRIADALLNGSTYDRLRVERRSQFSQPVGTKLSWLALLLASVALVAPISVALSPNGYGMDPLASSPRVAVFGLFSVGVVFAAACTLTGISLVHWRLESPLSERQAIRLLTLEELASLIGFITGSAAVAITLGLFTIGTLETGPRGQTQGGGEILALEPSGTGLSVGLLALIALSAAGVVLVLRLLLPVRTRE
jgi:hypothetical protein